MIILIAIPEKNFSNVIHHYLQNEGFLCEKSFKYNTVIKKIQKIDFDCILFDSILLNGDMIKALKELKSYDISEKVTIISKEYSVNLGIQNLKYEMGDYMVRPFRFNESSSRIFSVIERNRFEGNKVIVLNDLLLNLDSKTVFVGKKLLELTKMEYNRLLFLASNKNRIISKNSIAEHLYGSGLDSIENLDFIYTHIKNLIGKILKAGGVENIHSVYRMGYRFEV